MTVQPGDIRWRRVMRWAEAALLCALWALVGWLAAVAFRAEPVAPSCSVCGLEIIRARGVDRPRVRNIQGPLLRVEKGR